MQTAEQIALIGKLRVNVDRGADWLDKNRPDWEYSVNPIQLHLHDCFKCVLGQLFGDYWDALVAHFPEEGQKPHEEAALRGFKLSDSVIVRKANVSEKRLNWLYLTRLWRFVIISRREREAAQTKKETTCNSELAVARQS